MDYKDEEILDRREALKAEQKSLMDMLEHADTVEAIITIQSRLTDVRYELESYESQLRVYDNRIWMSMRWTARAASRQSSATERRSARDFLIRSTVWDKGCVISPSG